MTIQPSPAHVRRIRAAIATAPSEDRMPFVRHVKREACDPFEVDLREALRTIDNYLDEDHPTMEPGRREQLEKLCSSWLEDLFR